jgi:hypothetical protein
MIGANFLAGASLDSGNPEILLRPNQRRQAFSEQVKVKHHEARQAKGAHIKLSPDVYQEIRTRYSAATSGDVRTAARFGICGSTQDTS